MNVCFASNYLNVHQEPFCSAMVDLLGVDDFKFIATTPFDEKRLKSGYRDMNDYPYVIRAYDDCDTAMDAAMRADVLVSMPYCNPDFIRQRIETSSSLTFAYSERLLSRGLWFRHFPPKRLKVYKGFTRYRHDGRFHVLCASSFTSYDLSLFGFPASRCWKWGYFPRTSNNHATSSHRKDYVSIVWVARLIQWKRPYAPLRLAKRLMEQGIRFHLTMIGDGVMRDELASYIDEEGLSERVTMTGPVSNDDVHRIMASSNIFLFTSNRLEGWGAVLNEAMSEGCVPVASSAIGSVPFLIEDGRNGLIYTDGSDDSLYSCVNRLLNDVELLSSMSKAARGTMESLWNPCHAAESLLHLSESIIDGRSIAYDAGPCSQADIVPDGWRA